MEDATLNSGKMPTATKWVDRVKDDDGRTFVRCRFVARDFKPKHELPRDDLFAAGAGAKNGFVHVRCRVGA